MRDSILAFLLLFGGPSHADLEVIGGGLTYHLIDNGAAPMFSNKLSSDGRLIANPIVGLAYTQHQGLIFNTYTVFGGANSVGKSMAGGLYSEGLETEIVNNRTIDHFQFGWAIGGYEQQSHYYTDLGINSFRFVNVNGVDLVPVVGIVLNYQVNLNRDYYLKLNNLVSPVLLNSTVSFGINF